MPNPTRSDVHVDGPLNTLSIAYAQDQTQYGADRLFPVVPVAFKSDTYFTYDRGDWFRDEAQERAPGTESAGGGWRLSTDSYSAKRYAYHQDVDDETRANTQSPLAPDQDATEYVTERMLLKRENVFTSAYVTTGVWTGSTTGADLVGGTDFTQWDDPTSEPIQDIRVQITKVAETTGLKPNKLAIGPEVWDQLADHPDLLERIKYTERGMVGPDLLASLLGLDEVIIPFATRNTADEGATESMDFFWGKSATLLYSAPSPGLRRPSAGYIFAWTGFLGASAWGSRIKRFRKEEIESDRVEGDIYFDAKVVAPELGVHFSQAVA